MKGILLITAVIVSTSLFGQTTLKLTNNTNEDVYAAYVAYDFTQETWVEKGWYMVPANSESTIDLGSYRAALYLHGQTQGSSPQKKWGTGDQFGGTWCTGEGDTYELSDIKNMTGCSQTEEFTLLQIDTSQSNYSYSYTFNSQQ